MTSNFLPRYQGVSIHHCVIKGLPSWPLMFHHVIKGPIYHCVIKGPHFPPSCHQRDQNFQNMRCVLIKKVPYLKSCNRDKHVESLSRGVCRGGVKGIKLCYEVWGGAPESLLSMGPERPCYATAFSTRMPSSPGNRVLTLVPELHTALPQGW